MLASRIADLFSTLDVEESNTNDRFIGILTNFCLAALYLLSKGLIVDSENLNPHSKCLVDYVSGKVEFAVFAETFGLKNHHLSPTKEPAIFLLAQNNALIPETNEIIRFYLRKFDCLFLRATHWRFFDGRRCDANVDIVQRLNSTLGITEFYETRDEKYIKAIRNRIALFKNAQQTQRARAFLGLHRFGQNHANTAPAAFFTMPKDVARIIAREIRNGFEFCSPATSNLSPK